MLPEIKLIVLYCIEKELIKFIVPNSTVTFDQYSVYVGPMHDDRRWSGVK